MEKLNLSKKSLRRFGITMAIVFSIIALIILARHKQGVGPVFSIAAVFFALALLIPQALKPVYIIWMKLAFILGRVNTRLILLVMFYLVLTPVAVIMKLFNKDPLERKIEKGSDSYWIKKEKKDFSQLDYERQF